MLQAPATAKSVRIRNGRQMTSDGPFAETKEVLGGFNLIEAEDMDEAVRMAAEFPWTTHRLRGSAAARGYGGDAAARGCRARWQAALKISSLSSLERAGL